MGTEDEDLLLAVLNTTPVDGGVRQDHLRGADGIAWLQAHGGAASVDERDVLIEARDLLQSVVRGAGDIALLSPFLDGVSMVPVLQEGAVAWRRRLPATGGLAALVVLAWAQTNRGRPDRVKPCANPQCERFLLDRSRANTARWCSMATCGNRAKARRHYERSRDRL